MGYCLIIFIIIAAAILVRFIVVGLIWPMCVVVPSNDKEF
jgi:hypothetical protein